MVPSNCKVELKTLEQIRNDLNKPGEKDNGKNTTVRGTRVRRKEEQCDKKETTNVERPGKSQEDFKS